MTNIEEYKITIIQGETWKLTMTLTNDDGTVIDLTGYQIKMQIRKDYNDVLYQELSSNDSTIDLSDASQGIVYFNLDSTQTAGYDFDIAYYDIKFISTDDIVRYYIKGAVQLNRSITI